MINLEKNLAAYRREDTLYNVEIICFTSMKHNRRPTDILYKKLFLPREPSILNARSTRNFVFLQNASSWGSNIFCRNAP